MQPLPTHDRPDPADRVGREDAVDIALPNETATEAMALWIAPRLLAGDTILLEGPVGAGKSHFARALIHARLRAAGLPMEDVPSPTFTLIQYYDAGDVAIWHADLYRLTHPDEVLELGLHEAFESAICLVEWPDRLGADRPAHALTLTLTPRPDPAARIARLSSADPRWHDLLRDAQRQFPKALHD